MYTKTLFIIFLVFCCYAVNAQSHIPYSGEKKGGDLEAFAYNGRYLEKTNPRLEEFKSLKEEALRQQLLSPKPFESKMPVLKPEGKHTMIKVEPAQEEGEYKMPILKYKQGNKYLGN